jgi:hypothetical protein
MDQIALLCSRSGIVTDPIDAKGSLQRARTAVAALLAERDGLRKALRDIVAFTESGKSAPKGYSYRSHIEHIAQLGEARKSRIGRNGPY